MGFFIGWRRRLPGGFMIGWRRWLGGSRRRQGGIGCLGLLLSVCCLGACVSALPKVPPMATSPATVAALIVVSATTAPSDTATVTASATLTPTVTSTATAISTATLSASATPATKATATRRPIASATRAPLPTRTPAPIVQATATQEQVIAPSDTPAPADTATQAQARARIGALCNDDTSSNATGSGACSKHGGVKCWKYNDGTCTKP